MNKKQRKTLEKILELPTRADISWPDVQSLLGALDAEIREGNGSRVRVVLSNHILNMHKPHPERNWGNTPSNLSETF